VTDEPLRVETDARGVATVTLARPERHNALDAATMDALSEAAARLGGDPAVRVVVLAGEGESFCAGADLGWMRAQAEATREGRIREARRLADMLGRLDRLAKPLIARVQGPAYGGGLGLMAVADCALLARPGRFAFTEVRLGLIPATISPYVLSRMGRSRARQVFFSGRSFDADTAVGLGLAAAAVEPQGLDEVVGREVAAYLAAAPGAVARSKALAERLLPGPDEATVALTCEALADAWETAEAAEGIAAFFDKRRPGWREGS
jgi:methylglutaconyl-CoA hydratase